MFVYNMGESGESMKDAWRVMEILETHGYPSYLVGGAVRDALLGIEPQDYDLATAARPETVRDLFRNEIVSYRPKFGNVTLPGVEITTFRRDADYRDHRHPVRVIFIDTIEEDLARRDFTIGAMAYSEKRGFVDPYAGKKDLFEKKLVMIGDPARRLYEDAMRILRGIRFAARFELVPEESFLNAAKEEARYLNPKMRAEWERILTGEHVARALELMDETGALDVLFPAVARLRGLMQEGPFHEKDALHHTFDVVANTRADFSLRLAALYHDVGKADTKSLDEKGYAHFYGHANRSEELFRSDMACVLSSKEIDGIAFLIRRHMSAVAPYSERHLRRLVRESSVGDALRLMELVRADAAATNFGVPEFLDDAVAFLKKPVETKKERLVTGEDLIRIGYTPGPFLGQVLCEIEERLADDSSGYTKEALLAYARARKEEVNHG